MIGAQATRLPFSGVQALAALPAAPRQPYVMRAMRAMRAEFCVVNSNSTRGRGSSSLANALQERDLSREVEQLPNLNVLVTGHQFGAQISVQHQPQLDPTT